MVRNEPRTLVFVSGPSTPCTTTATCLPSYENSLYCSLIGSHLQKAKALPELLQVLLLRRSCPGRKRFARS